MCYCYQKWRTLKMFTPRHSPQPPLATFFHWLRVVGWDHVIPLSQSQLRLQVEAETFHFSFKIHLRILSDFTHRFHLYTNFEWVCRPLQRNRLCSLKHHQVDTALWQLYREQDLLQLHRKEPIQKYLLHEIIVRLRFHSLFLFYYPLTK